MKILNTKDGNILIASNIIFITKTQSFDYCDKSKYKIIAYDIKGISYLLYENAIEEDADLQFQEIKEYLKGE